MSKSVLATGAGVAGLLFSAVILASPAAAQVWTMPNLIGTDLQGAQDAIQSLTSDAVWYTGSTDLTGQGRMQVIDRAWVVCSSSPPPGSVFDATTQITFGVVKKDSESCP